MSDRVGATAWLLVIAWPLAACTLKADTGDAGTAGSDGGNVRVADQCSEIVTEFCSQAINRCGLAGFSLNDCITSDLPMCCTASVCSQTSQSPESAINACKAAIDAIDCNYIANSTLPGACQGLPAH